MRKPRLPNPLIAAALCLLLVVLPPAQAAPLVDADWLRGQLGQGDLVLLDASPPPLHAQRHIPGAIAVDVFGSGLPLSTQAAFERRLRDWGAGPRTRFVVYDQGGSFMATRVFYDLYYHGVPAERLFLLDGGMARWAAAGGAVTKDATPPPARGTIVLPPAPREAVRARLPEFLEAAGDPANRALVEALEPEYHFGAQRFFDRAGHVPHAILWPSADFFNADKTFKSADEIRRMLGYLGIRGDQPVYAHCGGGVAASVPFFALAFVAGLPQVKLYTESQMEWLRDNRGLPFWTYDAPAMLRDVSWLEGWNNRMIRMYGAPGVSVVDVRPAEAYAAGHVPFSLNVPAATFAQMVGSPERLAELLGPAGVDASHEAVVVSEGGLNPRAALAYLALESVGQKKVSLLMDTVDEWALRGLPMEKAPTHVGAPRSPTDTAVPPVNYAAATRPVLLAEGTVAAPAAYPRVYVAAGRALPARMPDGRVVHLPYTELLAADGTPRPAPEIWSRLAKAGVPRYAELVAVADEPGEAAVDYVVLRLMGFPDVKVLLR